MCETSQHFIVQSPRYSCLASDVAFELALPQIYGRGTTKMVFTAPNPAGSG